MKSLLAHTLVCLYLWLQLNIEVVTKTFLRNVLLAYFLFVCNSLHIENILTNTFQRDEISKIIQNRTAVPKENRTLQEPEWQIQQSQHIYFIFLTFHLFYRKTDIEDSLDEPL